MKIFSSFDTWFKQERLKFYRQQYGKDNVLILSASRVFLWLYIILPLLVSAILLTASIVSLIYFFGDYYGWISGSILIVIVFFSRDIHTVKKIMDYIMDFCIITPEEIVLVQQEWILNRTVKTLDTLKIKSIYINKKDLVSSVFDNGTLIFMSDGDETLGEIIFDYIADPEKVKDRIHKIIAPATHNPDYNHNHNS